MWMRHRILHVTAGCEENLQLIILLFMINVAGVGKTALSWIAFLIYPFTCATVCLSHLFFCKNRFVKTYSNDHIILERNYIRYP